MLKDNAKKYFLDQDFNCAETTLKIINDQYDLGLTDHTEISVISAGKMKYLKMS